MPKANGIDEYKDETREYLINRIDFNLIYNMGIKFQGENY